MTARSPRVARRVNATAVAAAAAVVVAIAVALLAISPPAPTAQQRMQLVRVLPETAEGLLLSADEQKETIRGTPGLRPTGTDADFSSGIIPSTVDPAECAAEPVTPAEIGVATYALDDEGRGVTLGSFSIVFATPEAALAHLDEIVRSRRGQCAALSYREVDSEGVVAREYTVNTDRYEDPPDGVPQVVLESTVRFADGFVYASRAVFDQLGNAIIVVFHFTNEEIDLDPTWADEAIATVHERVVAHLAEEFERDLQGRS